VLKEITDCLERGETVKLSSFGTFVVRKKGQRICRNPKTGTEVKISPRRVMVFKPSAILKQHINTGPAGINADVHYAELSQKAPPPT
jgi:integration host factor subunit alpha